MVMPTVAFGERNTLFLAVCFMLFTAIFLNHLPECKSKKLLFLENGFYVALALIGIINILNVAKNYKLNNEIQNRNIALIEEAKSSNSPSVELYKLINDYYGWSMPYQSSYHEYYFKQYYDIADKNIIWKNID